MKPFTTETALAARALRKPPAPTTAAHFDSLPDEATVPIKVFAMVAAESKSTLWAKAKAKTDPSFPEPIRRGARCTRFNVGSIRKYVSGGTVASQTGGNQ